MTAWWSILFTFNFSYIQVRISRWWLFRSVDIEIRFFILWSSWALLVWDFVVWHASVFGCKIVSFLFVLSNFLFLLNHLRWLCRNWCHSFVGHVSIVSWLSRRYMTDINWAWRSLQSLSNCRPSLVLSLHIYFKCF